MYDEPSVEYAETLLRKAARGNLPSIGDVLMYTQKGWSFIGMNMQFIAGGEFTYPQVNVAANSTEREDIEESGMKDILPTDFLLMGPPGGANLEVFPTVESRTGGFALFLTNKDTGAQDSLSDATDNIGKYLALRLVI